MILIFNSLLLHVDIITSFITSNKIIGETIKYE